MNGIMDDRSVCRECRHCEVEEILKGLKVYLCDENMMSLGEEEGCWRFERAEDGLQWNTQ